MNSKYTLAAVVSWVLCSAAFAGAGDESFFEFQQQPALATALDGACVGYSANDLLVLGGNVVADGRSRAVRSVYVLADGADAWAELETLPEAIAEGAVANAADGMICVGGERDGRPSCKVVRYSLSEGKLVERSMPDLPFPMADAAAAVVSDHLYVAGVNSDTEEQVFLSLDLLAAGAEWKSLPVWPGEALIQPAAAGVEGRFYLFGQQTAEGAGSVSAFEYDAVKGWRTLTSPPGDFASVLAGPCGDAHILLFDGGAVGKEILTYHTISDKWVTLGALPVAVSPMAFTAKGTEFSLVGTSHVVGGEAVLKPTKYSWIDHSVVAVFMVGMLYIGAYLAKREKNSQEYFRGGRRIPWWAAGLSLFATGASAVSLMSMPGKAFSGDWLFLSISFYIIVIFLPVSLLIYVPIARRLNVATAFEYLERRFNLSIRLYISVVWSLIQMLGRMAAVMLLPAYALSSIAGIPITVSILIMGVITTLYVYLGGLASVIWTDVIQAAIMIGAVGICTAWALLSLNAGAGEAWDVLVSAEKLHMFDWKVDWTQPCVLVMCLNVFVLAFGQIGDQNYIQRIQCTHTEREAKKAIITQLAVAVPLNVVLFTLGTVLFLFYRERPEMLSPAVKADAVFPLFAAQNLPIGLAGLVIVAVLAATMSTLSSALNSVANIGVEDFYRRLFKGATDHKCLILGRVLTACLGVFGTVAALVLVNTNLSSIWDLYLTILGILLGASAGVFTLGIFTRRANSAGVLIGAIASFVAVYYVKNHTHLHFFLYQVVGVVTCVVVGYIASLLIRSKKKSLDGLTVYTISQRVD